MSDIKDITNLENDRESGIGSLKNIIPPNIRMFVYDLLGGKEKFTEKDLTRSDRELLKEIAAKGVDKGSIGYSDYGIRSIDKPFLSNIVNARYNLKTLLGKAKVEINDQGELVLKDEFNFDDAKDVKNLEDFKFAIKDIFSKGKEKGLYGGIRAIGTYFGSGPGEGIPVEINLGKYKNI